MSETITPEYIAHATARDERVKAAVLGIDIEHALQSGAAFRVVIDALEVEQRGATEQLIACPPDQIGAIAALQAQVRAYVLVRECLRDVLDHGKRAELALRDEAAPRDDWA